MSNLKDLARKNVIHIVCIAILFILNCIYFYPQLEGKRIVQTDILSSEYMYKEVNDYSVQTGKYYLWNNGQFSGMPRLLNARVNKIWTTLLDAFSLGFKGPIGLFTAMMICSYIMFIVFGLSPWLALIFSTSIGLFTGNLILWEAGHVSKLRSLAFIPLIIAGIFSLFEKKEYLIGAALLLISFPLSIFGRHYQMLYYVFIFFLIYGVILVINTAKNKDWNHFLKAAAIVVVTAIMGLGSNAARLAVTQEYVNESIRGKSSVLETGSGVSRKKGLDWDYAMQWSNGVNDLFSSVIPGFVGGSTGEKVSQKSSSFKQFRINEAPLYWGSLPFTEGPNYFGIVISFLFVLGLFFLKGPFKWWIGIGIGFGLLLSMGKNFEILNKLFFNYFPLYNNFRVPQSYLNAVYMFIPLLGGVFLSSYIRDTELFRAKFKKKKKKKKPDLTFQKQLRNATLIFVAPILVFLLFGTSLFSFESLRDAQYGANVDVSVFVSDRKALFTRDVLRSLVLVLLIAGLMYFYYKQKINKNILIAGLGLLVLFDFWSVGKRYLNKDSFSTKSEYSQNFIARDVDKQILGLEKERYKYRVQDLTINTYNSAATSQFHNTVGGYHPAKLRQYQDLIEKHLGSNNMEVYNMLNTKYFIVSGQNNVPQLQVNNGALGNAWFIDEIVKVNTPLEEINTLGNIKTATQAVILSSEFNDYVGAFDPVSSSNNKIELVSYEPDHLAYSYNANAEQFVVFSESWYGPNLGWQAYIDGAPVEHIRVNYCLRGMKVPSGNHQIEFKFAPASYKKGKLIGTITTIINCLLFLGIIAFKLFPGLSSRLNLNRS